MFEMSYEQLMSHRYTLTIILGHYQKVKGPGG
jgi:hypothetical protein